MGTRGSPGDWIGELLRTKTLPLFLHLMESESRLKDQLKRGRDQTASKREVVEGEATSKHLNTRLRLSLLVSGSLMFSCPISRTCSPGDWLLPISPEGPTSWSFLCD